MKYEEIYLHTYDTIVDVTEGGDAYATSRSGRIARMTDVRRMGHTVIICLHGIPLRSLNTARKGIIVR